MARAEALAASRRSGFYVASRASIPERSAMWRDLRTNGMKINSTWIDEAGEGETGSFVDLWLRIAVEISRSQALILYAETGDFPLKGALVEVGIAIGQQIPIGLVLPGVQIQGRSDRPVGSWMRHPLVQQFESVRAALAAYRAANPETPR